LKEIERKRLEAIEIERQRIEKERQRLLEKQRQYEAMQQRLRQIGQCPAGFNWYKCGNGWRCGGGSHYV
jgi:hypothetical protein